MAYRDVAEAHFDGHPYAARRAVDHAIRAGNMQEHIVEGPQGGTFKVLTLTEQEHVERSASRSSRASIPTESMERHGEDQGAAA